MSGFLERWSRNKRAAEAAVEGSDGAEPADIVPTLEETTEADENLADEELLKTLPRLEDITLETDILPFLQRGVPRALKNAALRKMWLLDPRIRDHRDVAVDYAWDWNTPGGVPGNGGRIAKEGVEKLVRSLFDKPDTADSKPEVVPTAESGNEPVQHASVTPVAISSDPMRNPIEAGPAARDVGESGENASNQAEIEVSVPKRRHGGALPV